MSQRMELGYDGVEFPGGVMDKATPEELVEKLNEAGLELAGLTFDYNDFTNKLDVAAQREAHLE